MIATFIISFREFLEAFLIAGIFLGLSRKLELKKELEIIVALIFGIISSLLITLFVFAFSSQLKFIFNEETVEIFEGFTLVFSGLFIIYIIYSLHDIFQKSRNGLLSKTTQKLQNKIFDISLFTTIVFLVLREGLEIAIFTASVSLFTEFIQNMSGLLLGFLLSAAIGLLSFLTIFKLPIKKMFEITEYMIILMGAAFFQNGITTLSKEILHFNITTLFPLYMGFLPDSQSVGGHLFKNFVGVSQNYSLAQLIITTMYIAGAILLLKQKKTDHM